MAPSALGCPRRLVALLSLLALLPQAAANSGGHDSGSHSSGDHDSGSQTTSSGHGDAGGKTPAPKSEEASAVATKEAKVSRSGWTEGDEPPDRCHATLVDTKRTCCWREKETRVYTTRSKSFVRWACADLHHVYKDCLEVAHRYAYPGKAAYVHLCTREEHNYFLYYVDMVLRKNGKVLVPTEEMLPILDVSLQHALEDMLNITHRSVVIAQGARLDLLNGETMQGVRMVFHFSRDRELEATHAAAMKNNEQKDLAEINAKIATIAEAISNENALLDMGNFAKHMNEEFQVRPLVNGSDVYWLNITVTPAERVDTDQVAVDASVHSSLGVAGLLAMFTATAASAWSLVYA
eukprot:TRINITY_DN39996_c0_g1_i1.p1 TRINITY_DN39996_c0_g1~~TRINITY_DN39996_c0_g1_i1.p1  ORF type:complete len:384 (+),score=89.24 TRINITY_DN39996_c0_g1_i1:103-1152(+)